MPRADRKTCRQCGKHVREVGPISHAGYCGVCGPAVRDAWNDALHYHRGPQFASWRRAVAASVGAVLVDDEQGQ